MTSHRLIELSRSQLSSACGCPSARTRRSPAQHAARARSLVPWMAAGLTVVCLIVYTRTCGFGSLSLDDAKHIFENPAMNPPSLAGILHFWTAPYFGLYIPITYTLWAVAAVVGWRGGRPPTAIDPAIFHGLNVAVHAANAVLVFSVLRSGLEKRAPNPRRDLAAGLGALLFAVHPIQVEAVAWISGMKDLLFGFFALAGFGWCVCRPQNRFHRCGSRRRWPCTCSPCVRNRRPWWCRCA